MSNITTTRLLNDYIVEIVNEVIDIENDRVNCYVDEIVIEDFRTLVKYVYVNIKRDNKGCDFSDVIFSDLYKEVEQEIRCQYGSEIDEIYVDEMFIEDIKEIIKINVIGE